MVVADRSVAKTCNARYLRYVKSPNTGCQRSTRRICTHSRWSIQLLVRWSDNSSQHATVKHTRAGGMANCRWDSDKGEHTLQYSRMKQTGTKLKLKNTYG